MQAKVLHVVVRAAASFRTAAWNILPSAACYHKMKIATDRQLLGDK